MVTFSSKSINTAPDLAGLENSLFLLANRTFFFGVMEEGRTDNRTGRHLTNSELAFVMEYGAPEANPPVPARPFLGPVLYQNIDVINQAYSNALTYYLRGEVTKGDEQLYALGNYLVAQMKKRILSHIPPPLRPKTLALRRSKGIYDDTPLKETAQLMESIGFRITNIGPSVVPPTAPPAAKTSFFGKIIGKVKGFFGF